MTALLARLTQPAAAGEWERHGSQRSGNVYLEAGERILLEAISSNQAASGALQVGVRVPGSEPRWVQRCPWPGSGTWRHMGCRSCAAPPLAGLRGRRVSPHRQRSWRLRLLTRAHALTAAAAAGSTRSTSARG